MFLNKTWNWLFSMLRTLSSLTKCLASFSWTFHFLNAIFYNYSGSQRPLHSMASFCNYRGIVRIKVLHPNWRMSWSGSPYSLILGWLCDQLWPISGGGNDGLPVPSVDLKGFTYFPLLSWNLPICHVITLGSGCWWVTDHMEQRRVGLAKAS